MKKKFMALIAITLAGTGCVGPIVPVKDMNEVSAEDKRAFRSLPIYNESQLLNTNYRVISIVEGISCKNLTWDPAATKTEAIDQAKYWAWIYGADGILNVQCDIPRGTSASQNCWESITCSAQAININ